MSQPRRIVLNRYDLILAGSFLLLAGIILICGLRLAAAPEGQQVEIRQAGVTVGSYALADERELDFTYQGIANRVCISQGQAWVEEATCPDQHCVLHQPISRQGEAIICLPSRLVVTIGGGEEGGLDGVAQ